MGPYGDSVLAEGDRKLKAAREAYPEWDIRAVFAGYLATPAGTPVIQSSDVDGIVGKIRRLEADGS